MFWFTLTEKGISPTETEATHINEKVAEKKSFRFPQRSANKDITLMQIKSEKGCTWWALARKMSDFISMLTHLGIMMNDYDEWCIDSFLSTLRWGNDFKASLCFQAASSAAEIYDLTLPKEWTNNLEMHLSQIKREALHKIGWELMNIKRFGSTDSSFVRVNCRWPICYFKIWLFSCKNCKNSVNLEDVCQGDLGKRKMGDLITHFILRFKLKGQPYNLQNTLSPHTYACRKQSEVKCLAQGHFDVWTGGADDLLSHSGFFDFTACSASMKRWRWKSTPPTLLEGAQGRLCSNHNLFT